MNLNHQYIFLRILELQTLKIKQKDYQAKFWPQAQCITDITGYLALAKIKTLRHLHIESVKVRIR